MIESTGSDTVRDRPTRDYDALIGFGSNVGDKAANIHRAVELLCKDDAVRLCRLSRLYRSEPWGIAEQDWFVNACAAVATKLTAESLLDRCLAVEDRMGRRRTVKWGPRVIDVDVLTYRGDTIDTPRLTVPHPFIAQRSFVALPLAEIAPSEMIGGRTVREIADELVPDGTRPL